MDTNNDLDAAVKALQEALEESGDMARRQQQWIRVNESGSLSALGELLDLDTDHRLSA